MVATSPLVPDLDSMDAWLDQLPTRWSNPEDRALVAWAFSFAYQNYDKDEWCMACSVASRVAQMQLRPESIAASLLHSFPKLCTSWEESISQHSSEVVSLLQGVLKVEELSSISSLEDLRNPQERNIQAEILRKMFLAIVDDIRVVIISLAWRAELMLALVGKSRAEQVKHARLTMDIFAPLANRLGIWQMKWVLEDLSFRFLEPESYKEIALKLDEKRSERLSYLSKIIDDLKSILSKEGIQADIMGRPKHIYSIWRKMNKKGLDFESLYDIRAIRILVAGVKDCYAVLGIIHNIWQPIPGEFDDYISHPKANHYKSLHTAVIGPEDRGLEVQIRTFDMHKHAELGLAAHWQYKEGVSPKKQDGYEQKISWLRQLLDWRDGSSLAQAFRTELFEDMVYVVTPLGKVLSLPMGATPIDFAYAIHTDLGHHCRGAKINGVMVPLSTTLQTGQRIEILTSKNAHPNVDWIYHGWVKTSRALSKIRQYIRQQNEEIVKDQARHSLDKLLRKYTDYPSLLKLKDVLGYTDIDAMLLALGQGDLSIAMIDQVLRDSQAQPSKKIEPDSSVSLTRYVKPQTKKQQHQQKSVLIDGIDGLLVSLARCCKPVPFDPIEGFITRGRGVTVHQTCCATFMHLRSKSQERCVPAIWSENLDLSKRSYPVDFLLLMQEHDHPFKMIGDLCAREKIRLLSMNMFQKDLYLGIRFTIEISDISMLDVFTSKISQIPYFVSIQRVTH